MKLSDFIVVRGRDRTEDCYMGDLERIDLSAEPMTRRLDTRLMGVDAALLQEAVAERDRVVGRTPDIGASPVATFDRRLLGRPVEFMTEAVGDWLEGFCFTWTADVADDWTELSADAPAEGWLEELAERNGKRVASLAVPVPEWDRLIRSERVYALQLGMRELAFAVVPVGYPGNVKSETVERSGTADESEVVTLVGTRAIYREGVFASKSDGDWKPGGRVTRTAELGSLDRLAVSFPDQRHNGQFLTKAVTTWVKVVASYMTYGGDGANATRVYAVRVGRSLYGARGIDRATVSAIVRGVKSRCGDAFNMDPATFDHPDTSVRAEAHLTVSLGSAEAVCEFRDAVTAF